MAKPGVLTPQGEDFPRWYQEVLARAELAENGPARGTMVIRPWGYALWELMQADMDARIKATGVQNAYFPLFIPMSFFEKEAEHVEGFAPELAVVTHGGGEELAEPLVVRPTSETVINQLFSKWIQSHRDLPLLLNQWCNVVRWELRPRLFLRTTEFLWQEGHTAHATYEEAQAETLQMLEVYRAFMEETLAIAVVAGEKSEGERFPGADHTYACEGLMRDGKALQMGTSHNLGHNFAKAFDITYLGSDGERTHVATTSWGSSTRMVGALIMAHGDDHGLRLPPAVAPQQVVIVPLAEGEVTVAADKLACELKAKGVRVHVDQRFHLSFGRRTIDWELKGVPVRIELGARELDAGQATLARRDQRTKEPVALGGAAAAAHGLLDEIQRSLYKESLTYRESHTAPITDYKELGERAGDGFLVGAWCGKASCEAAIGAGTGASIRCIPEGLEAPASTCLVDGAEATTAVLIAKAY